MIDTAGTITNAASMLHKEGAHSVIACTSHAVFSPPAIERLSSGVFQEVIVTNSIPVEEHNQVRRGEGRTGKQSSWSLGI
mmetsp:Transcript_26624/g.79113  ORF Transcript_26624/g.79113 Transcript_26624/m.79113 type:complete len:80 (+) Transcript_26624:1493-1732(+)